MKTAFLTSPLYKEHLTGAGHPESPYRLTAIEDRLKVTGLMDALLEIVPRPVEKKSVLAVHPEKYLKHLEEIVPRSGIGYLDPDTPVSPRSLQAAWLAAGAVVTAVDAVMKQEAQNAFCAVRPPGHHALTSRGMGFCLLNNVAIGARYAQQEYGIERVAIIDWDVHHGNGTQEIFYEDPTVFYFSVHQYPFYPGTGSEQERGSGAGEGSTLNCPLDSGAGDSDYVELFENILAPVLTAWKPELVMISAGFDAHIEDPLARMEVTTEGFGRLTGIVRNFSDRLCGGKIVSALEGGYNLDALAKSVEKHLSVLME